MPDDFVDMLDLIRASRSAAGQIVEVMASACGCQLGIVNVHFLSSSYCSCFYDVVALPEGQDGCV